MNSCQRVEQLFFFDREVHHSFITKTLIRWGSHFFSLNFLPKSPLFELGTAQEEGTRRPVSTEVWDSKQSHVRLFGT